jgi:16S rRNA C967 or C1407 C5-methylase (RsmB/RsmF family)
MNDAASTLGHARARRALVCNTILVSVAAGAVLALTASALVRDANAGPPGPSALNMQQRAAEGNTIQAFDSGAQRLELISEIRALRQEVTDMRSLMTSGKLRTQISNFEDMKLDQIELEIDYAKLRDAMRAQ